MQIPHHQLGHGGWWRWSFLTPYIGQLVIFTPENPNISLMEDPYQNNCVTCRFSVLNLVMVGGGDGLLLPLNQAMGDTYPENTDFSLMEDLIKTTVSRAGSPSSYWS